MNKLLSSGVQKLNHLNRTCNKKLIYHQMLANKKFYDSISFFYDEMIDFDQAVKYRIKQLEKIILPGMETAADIGCGTGIDSIALSKLGLNVISFDPSKGMLKIAKENSKKFNTKITFLNYSADEIPQKYFNKFGLFVSLGNTFANIPNRKLLESFKSCNKILKKEGRFIFQILNYQKILKEKKRIVKIRSNDEKYFIRFYDFLNNRIQFNIHSFSKSELNNSQLITTQIYPHTFEELRNLPYKAGFKKVKKYSGFGGEKFQPQKSNDLVIDCFS
jgi:glycine/sarcosine N-methyltransferase